MLPVRLGTLFFLTALATFFFAHIAPLVPVLMLASMALAVIQVITSITLHLINPKIPNTLAAIPGAIALFVVAALGLPAVG